MRFAFLIWDIFGNAPATPSGAFLAAWNDYLDAMRAEGIKADYIPLDIAPAAIWTDGEPHDAVTKGRGPRQPLLDAAELYRTAELSGVLTVECKDQEAALIWASRFPSMVSVEVRRIPEDNSTDSLVSPAAMREIARGRWADPTGIAASRVADIIWNRHDLVPLLLRALAETAPAGQLHMIGVGELESISMHAGEGPDDPTLDLLIAADIPADALMEILSGPWPEYLERWQAADRLRGVLSDAQIDELRARYESR